MCQSVTPIAPAWQVISQPSEARGTADSFKSSPPLSPDLLPEIMTEQDLLPTLRFFTRSHEDISLLYIPPQ